MKRDIRSTSIITGHYSEENYLKIHEKVRNILYTNIGGITVKSHYYKVYIGYTNNPKRRWDQHLKNYQKTLPQHPIFKTKEEYRAKRPDIMYLLYQTDVIEHARIIEDRLINDFNTHLVNKPEAGGTGDEGKPPHYVYLIIMRYFNLY